LPAVVDRLLLGVGGVPKIELPPPLFAGRGFEGEARAAIADMVRRIGASGFICSDRTDGRKQDSQQSQAAKSQHDKPRAETIKSARKYTFRSPGRFRSCLLPAHAIFCTHPS